MPDAALANLEVEERRQASQKSLAAPVSYGSRRRQRGLPYLHSGDKVSLSRKPPPLPEWHRRSSPDTPAEETADGPLREAAREFVVFVPAADKPYVPYPDYVPYFTLRL